MLSYFASEMVSATVRRKTGGDYIKGEWTPSASSDTSVQVIAPQPATADDLQMLPPGELVRNYLTTWITSEVHLWSDTYGPSLENPDLLVIGSRSYKIVQINDRSTLGNFYRAVMREEQANE
jgi:hypothetical protein